jgi:hypothetical protein
MKKKEEKAVTQLNETELQLIKLISQEFATPAVTVMAKRPSKALEARVKSAFLVTATAPLLRKASRRNRPAPMISRRVF